MNPVLAVLNALCKVLDMLDKAGLMKNKQAIRVHILACIDLAKEAL